MSLVILYFSDNAETNHLSNQQHWALWTWKEYIVKSRTLLVWMKLAFPHARTAKPDIQLIIVSSAHWLQENEITCFHLVDWIIQSWDNIYFVSKTIRTFNWTKHHLWWGVHRCDLLSLIEDLIFFLFLKSRVIWRANVFVSLSTSNDIPDKQWFIFQSDLYDMFS